MLKSESRLWCVYLLISLPLSKLLLPKVAWDVLWAPFSWAVTDDDVLGAAKAVISNNLESLCSFKNEIGYGPNLYPFIAELRLWLFYFF